MIPGNYISCQRGKAGMGSYLCLATSLPSRTIVAASGWGRGTGARGRNDLTDLISGVSVHLARRRKDYRTVTRGRISSCPVSNRN